MADLTAAGAVCYIQDNTRIQYLVMRAAKHGEWGPPKGHSDAGETELETAAREIFEEAGIRAASFLPGFREVLSYTVERKGKRLSKDVIFFLLKLDEPVVVLSEEHTEAHFATIEEVEVLVRHEDLRRVFRNAEAYIRNGGLRGS
jgi:8-oxo-dGTP pyrophosphatase MutT (NUDIX family)